MTLRRALALLVVAGLVAVGCSGGSHGRRASTSRPPAPAGAPIVLTRVVPGKADCALHLDNQAITGSHGTASAIGWAGNDHGVVTCLGGRFYVQGDVGRAFGFGIYAGGPTTWTDADGYLPAQVTRFTRDGLGVEITELVDRVTIGGHLFAIAYCRVAITNPTRSVADADPFPSPGLVPLAHTSDRIAPSAAVHHDYAVAVDRFAGSYAWPAARAIVAAGSFDRHFAHMRAFWNAQLAKIARVDIPDRRIEDAYRSGFVYTLIARSGFHSNTGVDNYEAEFSHDAVGILADLFTWGDDDHAHELLLDLRHVVGAPEYVDGLWTYSWPWAVYLLKTGDLSFVKANFATRGAAGAAEPSIEDSAHRIAADRTGPNGIIGVTNDIDSNGYWTVDDYEALMGLAAYRYLAGAVGNTGEAAWASAQYDSLLAATNSTLQQTMRRYHLSYLPCSMLQPNSANRCRNPEDANWAAPFLFGRWVWDGPLFGAHVSGPAADLVDATYSYGFGRLRHRLPPGTFGGYPSHFYSSGYNAGYGSGALAGARYRDIGIEAYGFMITHTQSGPYSWWESVSAPAPSPWLGSHPGSGGGSSPHAWGIANANKVLLDSLVAQRSDGTLVVGRGVPTGWLTAGRTISVTNFPTTEGQRASVTITGGRTSVSLTVRGATVTVLLQLPLLVDDIAGVTAGTVDDATGTVRLGRDERTVTVRLRHANA